jgi:hypothetical protein
MKRILKNITVFIISIITFFPSALADEGDTIKLQAFDYSQRGDVKEGWFVFPDTHVSYEKVYMYYSLKCDPLNTPYKCGEWDYLTYTYASKKTGTYDEFPNFRVDGETYDTFSYMLSPSWNYTAWLEEQINITDTLNLIQVHVGNINNSNETAFTQAHPFSRMQFLWRKDELKTAGSDTGKVNGIHVYLSGATGDAGRLILRFAYTEDDSFEQNLRNYDAFTTVFDQYIQVSSDGWYYLPFSQPFHRDTTANIIFDFAISNNINLQVNNSKMENTGMVFRKNFHGC